MLKIINLIKFRYLVAIYKNGSVYKQTHLDRMIIYTQFISLSAIIDMNGIHYVEGYVNVNDTSSSVGMQTDDNDYFMTNVGYGI